MGRRFSAYGSTLLLLLVPAGLAGCGGSSASSPTATPQVAATPEATTRPRTIVVTATGAPTAAVQTVVVTATPLPSATPKPGHSTPLPGATPVPAASGLTLGMITRSMTDVNVEQSGADHKDKRYAFYLHPDQVIRNTLPNYGFKPPVDLVSPAKPVVSYSGRPVRKAIVKYQGQLYRVYVAQPGRQGPTGVWSVVTILRQKLVLGQISRPMSVVQRDQKLANEGKKNFLYRLDPNKVVQVDLPQYGFDPDAMQIVTKAHSVASASGKPVDMAVVRFEGKLYDVYLKQPGVQGKKGVWVIVTINPV